MLRIVRRLRGTPKPNQQAEQDEEDNIPRVDNWTNSTSRLQVTSEPKSGTCTVSLRAKVDLPPDLLYNILTSPQNSVIFHGIKRTVDRKVIYQGPSRQTVDVVQEGQWRFLMFRGVFTTRLRVEEDKHTRTVVFRQTHPGFMKAFEGRWQLAPFTQETLDELYDVEHKHKWLGLRKAVAALEHSVGLHRPTASLATLEQSITPSVVPPGPLRALVGRITSTVVLNMLHDLQVAATRIASGELQWPPMPEGGDIPKKHIIPKKDIPNNKDIPSKHIVPNKDMSSKVDGHSVLGSTRRSLASCSIASARR